MMPDERCRALVTWVAGDPDERSRPEVFLDALRDALQQQLIEERFRCATIARIRYADPAWDGSYRLAAEGIAADIEAGVAPSVARGRKST
jgi:hypothetical protein